MTISERRVILPFVGLLVLLLAVPATHAADRIEKTFEVSPGGLLTIEAVQGSIEVSSHEGRDLTIEIVPKDFKDFQERFEVRFDQNGNQVKLEIVLRNKISRWFNWGNKGFQVLASVPYEFDLDLQTSGGSIQVGNILGDVRAATSGGSLNFGSVEGTIFGRTSGGSIDVSECTGETNVHTSGGGIVVGKVDGTLEAVTSGGSIRIDSGGTKVKAETSGGSIRIREASGSVDASTSGGSIEATLTGQPDVDCTLKTSGGGIRVLLADDLRFDIDAKASGGRVSSDLPLTVQGTLGKAEVRGQLNQGGPRLVLRTSGGGIHIGQADSGR